MLATIKQNKIGHLHVWKGDVHVDRSDKYNFLSENKESDLYLQLDSDIDSVIDILSNKDKDSLYKGYIVKTNIDNDYFDMQI